MRLNGPRICISADARSRVLIQFAYTLLVMRGEDYVWDSPQAVKYHRNTRRTLSGRELLAVMESSRAMWRVRRLAVKVPELARLMAFSIELGCAD